MHGRARADTPAATAGATKAVMTRQTERLDRGPALSRIEPTSRPPAP